LFLDRLSEWNGRRWFPRRVLLKASSDASDFGFGGILKVAGKPQFELAGSLTEVQLSMSSTAREMVGFLRTIQQTGLRFPELLRGSAVLVVGDNQGAVAALNQFRSLAPDVAASLREIFKICSSLDFDVLAQWRPREELAAEDALSRFPEASNWGLAPAIMHSLIEQFGRSSVDMFASDFWHIAASFVTPSYMLGCSAVDAVNRDWRDIVPPGSLAWVFQPLRAIPQALQRLKEFRINAVLIVPEAPTTNWWLELIALRARTGVEGPVVLDRSTSAYLAGEFRKGL
jgi:hypothetical protein